MAGIARFFTQKSRAARAYACNVLIQRGQRLESDIFDSHRLLHSPAIAGQAQPTNLGFLFEIIIGSFQIPGSLRGGITRVILRRMKTAISIPDEIFEQAERLAKTRGWSRSELYANAVSAFVNSERFSGVREKLDAVYGDGGQDSAIEPLLSSAQARSLAKEKW